MYMYLRQLIFLRKSDCLGCAVLLCLVVLACTCRYATQEIPKSEMAQNKIYYEVDVVNIAIVCAI